MLEFCLEPEDVIRPDAIRTFPPPNAAVSTLFARLQPHALRSTAIQAGIGGVFRRLSSEIGSFGAPSQAMMRTMSTP